MKAVYLAVYFHVWRFVSPWPTMCALKDTKKKIVRGLNARSKKSFSAFERACEKALVCIVVVSDPFFCLWVAFCQRQLNSKTFQCRPRLSLVTATAKTMMHCRDETMSRRAQGLRDSTLFFHCSIKLCLALVALMNTKKNKGVFSDVQGLAKELNVWFLLWSWCKPEENVQYLGGFVLCKNHLDRK